MSKQLPLLSCNQVLRKNLWLKLPETVKSWSHLSLLWPVTNQLDKGMILLGTKFGTQIVVLWLHLLQTGIYLDPSNKPKCSCLIFFFFIWMMKFSCSVLQCIFNLWTLKIFKLQNCSALVSKFNPLLSIMCHILSTTHLTGNAQMCTTHSTEKPGNNHCS